MRVDLRQRPFLLIASVGLLLAAAAAAGGWLTEQARLGSDDAAAFARVEQEVRTAFAQMSSALDRVALAEAANAERVLQQPAEERDLRPLFARAAELVGRDPAEPLAVTVYGPDGTPLAWAGRPAELTGAPPGVRPTPNSPPPDRFAGPPALFVAPGPLGFRLVRTQPVMAGGGRTAARLGIVAAEWVFSEQAAVVSPSPEGFSIDTSLGPIALRARSEGAVRTENAFSFVVRSPAGEILAEATVDPESLRAARREHRHTVTGLVHAIPTSSAQFAAPPCSANQGHDRHLTGAKRN